MNGRLLRILIMGAAVVFLAVAIITFIAYQRKPLALPDTILPNADKGQQSDKPADLTVSCFFFSENGNQMQGVSKLLAAEPRRDLQFRSFLNLIMRGEPGFIVPIPAGTQIRALYYLSLEKRLIVDFEEGLQLRVLKGSSAELSFIYFFVNNLCFNFKDIESVQFLIGGNEHETLAGHIVFDEPFFADYSYLSGIDEQ